MANDVPNTSIEKKMNYFQYNPNSLLCYLAISSLPISSSTNYESFLHDKCEIYY